MLGRDDLEGIGDCVAREKHRPQQRGFGLDVLGRDTKRGPATTGPTP